MEWCTIKQYPKYEINRDGVVRNKHTKKILSQRFNGKYHTVQIYDGVGARTCRVSKLVDVTFNDNSREGRILRIHLKIEGVDVSEENTL